MGMEQAIREIERLCQEKILLFQDLLSIIKEEKKTIIKADVGALWTFTSKKTEIADKVNEIRNEMLQIAHEAEIVSAEEIQEYSLTKIIAALPQNEKNTLLNLRFALVGIKTKIAALAQENKRYLEESLKTIEDLVKIITRSCDNTERYGRDTYLKSSSNSRAGLVYGEV